MNTKRADNEAPLAIEAWGWKYHHIGIPTQEKMEGERYIPPLKLSVLGFDTSPFGVEWMRFDEDSPTSTLVKTVPHIAFEVDDLDYELSRHDFHIISPPSNNTEEIRVAMIEHNGAPIELIEFKRK